MSKYQLKHWSILIVAIAIALSTASLIIVINRRAEKSNQAQIMLIYVREQLVQLTALEWQAIAEKELSSELLTKVQSARNQIQEISYKLENIEPQKSKLQKFSQLHNQYNVAVDKEFELLAARQISQAIIVDEEYVDPTYEKLSTEIIKLNTDYSNQKQQANQMANRVSALALLVSTGLISVLFWKFIQAEKLAQLGVAEQKILSQSEERFKSLIQNASDVIIVINAEAEISYVTVSSGRVLGYLPEDLVGTKIENLVDADNTLPLQNFISDRLEATEISPSLEIPFRHQDGHLCYVELFGNNLLSDPRVNGIVLTLRDISDRKQALELLRYHAFHDSLTNLPNRALFNEHLQQAVKQAKRNEHYTFAVLFLDLDRFKLVNDSLGHKIGDELLCAVAQRLKLCLREGDTLARLGGDEFTLLIHNLQDIEQVQIVAERIKQELSLPFYLHGHELFISTSIGIATHSNANDWLDNMLRNADIAMYRAKALGRANYEVFDKTMHVQVAQRLQLETDLQQAVAKEEFIIHYQPIVDLKDLKIKGFEALVRWQHPVRGLVSPLDFIPLAEETGLIVPIGKWVMREACKQMQAWQSQFPNNPPMTISINVSSKQFSQPYLIQQIQQILQETGLNPSSLTLEITESVLIENTEFVAIKLTQLKAMGIQISLDDFGTGYSSLNYLYCLPINILKIDRSFVCNLDTEITKIEVIRAIVVLAWNLGIKVVTEGIETPQQMYHLKMLKCEYGQGYLFSKPLNSEMTEALIAQNFPLYQTLLGTAIVN
ncbi:putative bifunctional diguanylate cyclase/phosphodiesterase [Synechocystis sp. PCC 7509]|uniref:putative bifunctional diguanylate cyclase/phosphodiesterase n=1 Tax=Synechocystis sp. PCC 7509 TaxID=927677 RepID=UPI00192AE822|nr:EAL domain-containing protein [Synechocystis sp. PCC 7509]